MPDQRNGRDRYIDFLSYPCNYVFIPSTYSDPRRGGDDDALDILAPGSSITPEAVQQVVPIGLLKLTDDQELDYKVIAIPADEKLRYIQATTW